MTTVAFRVLDRGGYLTRLAQVPVVPTKGMYIRFCIGGQEHLVEKTVLYAGGDLPAVARCELSWMSRETSPSVDDLTLYEPGWTREEKKGST